MNVREGGEAERASGDAAGACLRRWRHERQISLAELARLAHYSKGYLSKVENGEKPMTPAVARECDRALDTGGALAVLAVEPRAGPGTRPDVRIPVVALGPALPVVTHASVDGPPPLCVGRERELQALTSCSNAVSRGSFRVVWVAGEAGVGKSTLAAALSRLLADGGWQVAWGRCPQVDGAPSAWPWTEVAGQLLGATADRDPAGDGPVPDGLAEMIDNPRSFEPAAPFWTARALAQSLARHGEHGPVLVVLDDVHRDRGETLHLLRHLFAELGDCPVMVLATFRATEAGPELGAAQAALAGARVEQIELGGLENADVGRLLFQLSGTIVAPGTVTRITARTGGNPLFVSETARLIRTEGIEAATRVIPAGVRHVLRHRLAALPPGARAVLRTAAVLGLEADVDVLLALDPDREDAVLDGLEAAVHAGLLNEPATGTVRFTHALVRELLYEDIPRARRRRMHALVLEVLGGGGEVEVAALAHHALAAATPASAYRAAGLAARSAAVAVTRSAPQEAAVLLEQALQVLDLHGRTRVPGEDGFRLDLLCSLVSAQAHAGNVLAARSSRRQAIELATVLDRPGDRVRAYTAYDAPALWTVHAYQQMDAALVTGLEQLLLELPAGADRDRARLLATLAMEVDANDPGRTDRASAQAVDLARRLGDPELLCHALNARYIANTLDPDASAELEQIGAELLALATAAGLTGYQAQGHQILFMAALSRHDLDLAQSHVDRAVEHATTGQLGLALGVLGMFDALRALIAGRLDEADRRYAQISAQLRSIGDPNADTFDLLVRFCVEHARGSAFSRARVAQIVDESATTYARLGEAISEPYTRGLVAAGLLEQARSVWRPHLPIRRDFYWLLWTVFRAENALHLGDLAVAAGCYAQLRRHAGQIPELVHGHIAVGPVDHTLGELASALGRPQDAVGHYHRAIALAERIGAPHWAARSRTALAHLSWGGQVSGGRAGPPPACRKPRPADR